MRRSLQRAEASDLALVIVDISRPLDLPEVLTEIPPERRLLIGNKCDLGQTRTQHLDVAISAKSGAGLEDLISALTTKAKASMGQREGEAALVTRARQRLALQEALEALERSRTAVLPELFAEELRLALRAFGKLAGRVDVEEILDRIFGDFCIGK